jgi:GH24 family phage-related lysozyme (muramidase)
MGLKIGQEGLDIIKQFEGCRLKAYKCAAGVWTIGYGHTKGVKEGQSITQKQADDFLISDIETFEKKVNKYNEQYAWNQNEFDAMVSFAFNVGNIDQLTGNGKRSKDTIADKMLLYNKAAGKELTGLTKRRKAERNLFLKVTKTYENSKERAESEANAATAKIESAKSRNASLSGTYKVTPKDGLNLRTGAGKEKTKIGTIPYNAMVKCYGYYTEVSDVKWLYVVYNGMEGFVSSKYLKK